MLIHKRQRLYAVFFYILYVCQLQWVNEKSYSGENRIGSLLFDIQSDENSSFKVVKVPKAKSVALDNLDKVVSGL